MKKKFTIEVDINTELAGTTAATASRLDTSNWRVRIRKDLTQFPVPVDSQSIAAAVAHELGHVLGFQCGLSGNIHDSRFGGDLAGVSYKERVINSENEAWDIAEVIFKRLRQYAIKEYEGSLI